MRRHNTEVNALPKNLNSTWVRKQYPQFGGFLFHAALWVKRASTLIVFQSLGLVAQRFKSLAHAAMGLRFDLNMIGGESV
jgi:uncharacterized membrane protein